MKNIFPNFILILIISLVGCTTTDEVAPNDSASYNWAAHQPFTTEYQTFTMPYTNDYEQLPDNKGTVSISEASGLAYSVKNPGMIWTHNDSGHANVLFLLNAQTGEIMARYTIRGASNIDWEDMEIALDRNTKTPYIYVADIGDNSEKRNNYAIYKFVEPTYDSTHYGKNIQLQPTDFSKLNVTYPDGSHDAESLLVDPFTNDIYIVTKRDFVSTLYVLPYPFDSEKSNKMFKVGMFSFKEASAGTISLDGSKIMIKNRQEIFYWVHNFNQPIWKTLSQTPVKAPYIGEPQGEAIAFDPEHNYYTLSEELNSSTKPILYKYLLK